MCWSCLWGYSEELCAGEGQSFLSFLVSSSTDCEDEADLPPLPPHPDSSALPSSKRLMLERGPILNFHAVLEPSPGTAETFGAALWAPKQMA